MKHLIAYKHLRRSLRQGALVRVTCSSPCNVWLLNNVNFHRYKKGARFRGPGGGVMGPPAEIVVPSDGVWNIVVDLNSPDGNFEFGVKVYAAYKPRIRATRLIGKSRGDAEAVKQFAEKRLAGTEELIPAEIVDRILAGESKVRVWREYRHLSKEDLADRAGVSVSELSQIEDGRVDRDAVTIGEIAKVLGLSLDDLA